jgi:hypothetical protein
MQDGVNNLSCASLPCSCSLVLTTTRICTYNKPTNHTPDSSTQEVFGGADAATGPTTTVTVVEGPVDPAQATAEAEAVKEAAMDAASSLIGHDDADSVHVAAKDGLFASEPPVAELVPEERGGGDSVTPLVDASKLVAVDDAAPVYDAAADPAAMVEEEAALAAASEEADAAGAADATTLGTLEEPTEPADVEGDAPLLLSEEEAGATTIPPPAAGIVEGEGQQPHVRRILGRALPATTGGGGGGGLVLPAVIDYRYADFNPYKLVAVTPVKVCGRVYIYCVYVCVCARATLPPLSLPLSCSLMPQNRPIPLFRTGYRRTTTRALLTSRSSAPTSTPPPKQKTNRTKANAGAAGRSRRRPLWRGRWRCNGTPAPRTCRPSSWSTVT